MTHTGVQGLASKVQGSGFRVQGARFEVQGLGFRVRGAGCRILRMYDSPAVLVQLDDPRLFHRRG